MGHSKKQSAWWYYFWLVVLSNVASIFLDPPDLEGWAHLLLSGVALLGLWGYLRDRALGHHVFWGAFICISLSVVVYYLVRALFLGSELRTIAIGGAVIGLTLGFPLLLALWRYAFRSPHIWRVSGTA